MVHVKKVLDKLKNENDKCFRDSEISDRNSLTTLKAKGISNAVKECFISYHSDYVSELKSTKLYVHKIGDGIINIVETLGNDHNSVDNRVLNNSNEIDGLRKRVIQLETKNNTTNWTQWVLIGLCVLMFVFSLFNINHEAAKNSTSFFKEITNVFTGNDVKTNE